MLDRYQSGFGMSGAMPTEEWFAALMRGVSRPLGAVLDVGCAEGVMCVLAARQGAEQVLGIGLHTDRMAAAQALIAGIENVAIAEMPASEVTASFDTIIYSMMAHWLGQDETARIAALARRWFLVVFRAANNGYAVPINGTWFPTLGELDATVGGVRTHEELVLTQDAGKEVWAATYRTDMEIRGSWVHKRVPAPGLAELIKAGAPIEAFVTPEGYAVRLVNGRDLHDDEPWHPRNGKGVLHFPAVDELAAGIAAAALRCGWYPTDFSPRNVILDAAGAHLIDLAEMDRTDGTVPEPYRTIWERTLGRPFSGRLADLL